MSDDLCVAPMRGGADSVCSFSDPTSIISAVDRRLSAACVVISVERQLELVDRDVVHRPPRVHRRSTSNSR